MLADSNSTSSVHSSCICAVCGMLTLRFRSRTLMDIMQTQTAWFISVFKKLMCLILGKQLNEAQCLLKPSFSPVFSYSLFLVAIWAVQVCFRRWHPPLAWCLADASSDVEFPQGWKVGHILAPSCPFCCFAEVICIFLPSNLVVAHRRKSAVARSVWQCLQDRQFFISFHPHMWYKRHQLFQSSLTGELMKNKDAFGFWSRQLSCCQENSCLIYILVNSVYLPQSLLFSVTLDYLKIIWHFCLLIELELVNSFLFDQTATTSPRAEAGECNEAASSPFHLCVLHF